jgi:hypothetical protein
MLVSPECFTLLARLVAVAGALSWPGGYPPPQVPCQEKARALSRLALTGDGRDCDAVLDAVRKNRAWAEDFLKGNEKAEKELVRGILNDLDILSRCRTERDRASRMRDIESHNQSLLDRKHCGEQMR